MPERQVPGGRPVQLRRVAILLLLAAGCQEQTGIELKVTNAMSPTSIDRGVASLELVTAQESFCERRVRDQSASGTIARVRERDLGASPYRFFIHPSRMTDLGQPVFGLVLARDANDNVIGFAAFGDHTFQKGQVNQYTAEIEYVRRSENPYVADCVCLPGVPWISSGS